MVILLDGYELLCLKADINTAILAPISAILGKCEFIATFQSPMVTSIGGGLRSDISKTHLGIRWENYCLTTCLSCLRSSLRVVG